MRSVVLILIPAVIVGVMAAVFLLQSTDDQNLVVYCAHDAIHSEAIIKEFEAETGIKVRVQFDSEATKSLGLVERLKQEADAPICDVFWNNELLGMLDLAESGVLQPYRGTGWERIPATFKDAEGLWTGFAARLRVYIVNTDKLQPTAAAVETLLRDDPTAVAIAKPLYGTTLTHYSLLWKRWGGDKLKRWHQEQAAEGRRIVGGNSVTMKMAADGVIAVGYTDTDDYYIAADAGKPVAMLPVDIDGQTICIPNTVAVIAGTKRQQMAQRFVDFLLSARIEERLAAARARQIPLGPVDESKLPPEMAQLREWAAKGLPLAGLQQARRECLDWLKTDAR